MELIVEISTYIPDDLHFNYGDESEWFDATELRILLPKEYENTIFYLYHKEEIAEGDIWRESGKILKLIPKISPESIDMLIKEIHFTDEMIYEEINTPS